MRGAAIVAVVLFASSLAHAQGAPIEVAIAAYESGDVEGALAAFERARQSSSATPHDLHRIYLHLGVLHAVMGDAPSARRDFAVALAIGPDTEAPAELAPDQRQLFEEVRASARPMALDAQPVGEVSSGAPSTVQVRVRDAPVGLVARLRARATPASGGQPWTVTVDASDPAELVIPVMAWRSAQTLEVTVEALSEHGGVLAASSLTLRHGVLDDAMPGPREATQASPGGSVLDEAWFWIVIGVVVAGGAALAIGLALTVGPETYVLEAPTVQR